MTQAEMERELAEMTGESVSTIRHHGFQLIETPTPKPRMVNWDRLDSRRVAVVPQRSRPKRRQAA